jgi:4-hydroxy-4-methyl-2-oxoglutarate aldolase
MIEGASADQELFLRVRRELYVAVVGDALDQMGLRRQFLHPSLKPIENAMIIVGRAMPVLEADFVGETCPGHSQISTRAFGRMFEALDDLKAGEIYICSGSSHRYALWGGLMSTRAQQCGAAGAVVHGYHRDTSDVLRSGFPLASFGSYAQDQGPRGKVVDWRIPIEVDDVLVRPGDVIYGDRDGVLVVPAEAADEAFDRAFTKATAENKVLDALRNGMRAADAFQQFGVM